MPTLLAPPCLVPLPPGAPDEGSRRRRTWAWLAAAVVVGSLAVAATQAIRAAPQAPSGALPAAVEETVDEAAAARRKARCATCGHVLSIRPLATAAGAPARYAFTVRLHDGTSRTSEVADVGSWRAGDRILLIGDAAADGS